MGDITKAIEVIQSIKDGVLTINHLVDAFAEVRAETIEACAKVCDKVEETHRAQARRRLAKNNVVDNEMANGAKHAAAAVRGLRSEAAQNQEKP